MSVTEFKRKSKKTYFLLGTVVVLLPALPAVLALALQLGSYSRRNKELEKELSGTTQQSGYILTEDVSKGQKIEEDMLQKVLWRSSEDITGRPARAEEFVGKYAKCDFAEGTSLNSQCVYEEAAFTDSMRIQDFEFIEINSMVCQGDYIDIRIVYPSGEDYIVANHKKVLELQRREDMQNVSADCPRLFLQVSEEEILRIASAYVDTVCYEGSRIYVLSYLDQFQQAGIVNYPVNPQVFELLGWNPNVVGYTPSEQEKQQRRVLEEHLSVYASEGMSAAAAQRIVQDDLVSETAAFFE